MAVRVDQLVPYGYTDTAISTFHAFGDRLIREYALELGLPTDVRVLSRPEVVIFLREHLFEFELDAYRPLGDPTRFLAALATLFSRCKDEDIAPGGLPGPCGPGGGRGGATSRQPSVDGDAGHRRTRPREDARRQAELAAGVRDVPATCWPRTAASISATRSRWRCDSSGHRRRPATAIAGRFRYILVDEFQDTNRAQAELVAALADGHRNVTVVGDDDQAIYAFRGAAVDNILAFQDRYLGARTVVLRRNYRSLAPVLDAAYRLIRFNDPDRLEVRTGIVKRLRPQRLRRARRRSASRCSRRARRKPTGSPPRSAGGSRPAPLRATTPILVRANGHADPILRALNMAGIPWRFSGTSGLYARPEVRLLLAFLRVVADLDSSVDLYALAASEVYGLGGEDLTAIVNMARRRNRSVWAVLEELDRQPGILRVGPETRATVERSSRTFAATRRRPTSGRPASCCTGSCARAACSRGWSRRTPPAAEEAAPEHRAVLRDRPRAVCAARRRSRGLRRAAPGDAHRGRRRSGDRRARSGRRCGGRPDRPQGKGPRVPGRLPARAGRRAGSRRTAAAIRWPLPAGLGRGLPPNAEAALAEERRLCYVAMTRARDELVLCHAADYGGARARRVSPFVLEALDLPAAAGVPGRRRADVSTPVERLATFDRSVAEPGRPGRPDHRTAVAELLPDRRLPDLPAQVQVRARACACRSRRITRSSTARRCTRPSSSSTTGTPGATS